MTPEELARGSLTVQGRLLTASNETYVGEVDGTRVVYKPVAGERPLWDFPDGTLANREVAAYEVSQALGWEIVPPTLLRDGPRGRGMVQAWCDHEPAPHAVDVVPSGSVPAGMRHVLDGFDANDRPVSLVHEDSPALRRMAVFDALINNADRKGGHVLVLAEGRRVGVDHGVSFHTEPKLRTVLWGWAGEALDETELDGVARVADQVAGPLGERLAPLVSQAEAEALVERASDLLGSRRFPLPQDTGYPAIPWPPF